MPADAASVVSNETATDASGNGFAVIYSCGAQPTASNLNYVPGQSKANMVQGVPQDIWGKAGTVCEGGGDSAGIGFGRS